VTSVPASRAAAPQRVPLDSDEPATLVGVYECFVARYPRPDTLNYKRNGVWQKISANEMLNRGRRIGLGLYSLGVRKGDRVALLSESRPEWVLADQGCILSGVITVPIYPTLTPPQVEYILRDCGAQVLFVSSQAKFAEVSAAIRNCETVTKVILFEVAGPVDQDWISLIELESRGARLDAEQPTLRVELASAARPEDLATIIYTSGTTANPKA
jgi:long-chain acyl-CoA synthetase